jgi:hypothetical protein
MLNALKDVQSDDSVVGFYIATPFNAFFTQSMLEMQSAHQARLRQGGIVVVHGQWVSPAKPRAELTVSNQTRPRHSAGPRRSARSG